MWILVFFDLPVQDTAQRKNYTRFRKKLLSKGLVALQFSVYYRYCNSQAAAEALITHLQNHLPPAGQVRFLPLNERTFSQMTVFQNQELQPAEQPPNSFVMF